MFPLENKTLFWTQYPFSGTGFIGGNLPPDPNPASPDGRTKIMDEPKSMRVLLLDGKSRRLLDETKSRDDGTWGFHGLKLNHRYAVEFVNDGQYTNIQGVPYNSFVQDFVYAMPLTEMT